ncbi:MAG: MFS transporter [Alphaproteobacteria bacterium]|nr:MFS transporter [Alphaproteobacteria bacterium]
MVPSLARRLPFFYGWVIVAVAFVTMAIGVNARTSFSLLFPAILDEFGWDRATTAGAFSFGFLVAALLGPVTGRLMDRRGPIWVMELGTLAIAAGLALASLATQPWQLYLTQGVLVGGGTTAVGYSGQALYLPNWFLRRRALAISIAYAGAGIGSIILLPLVQAIILAAGWRTACLTLAALALVVLAPLNLLLRRRPQDLGLTPDGDSASQAIARRSVHIVDTTWAATKWTLPAALRTARFWWLALANAMAMYAWYAVQVHQTKYLLSIGIAPTLAAWALGFVSLAGIPGQIALGALSDRIGREPVWTIGCLGFVLTYTLLIALSATPHPALLVAMILAQGVLGYGITSVFGPVAAEVFDGPHFGTIFGTVMIGAMSGAAAGPFIHGLLHDITGSDLPGFTLGILASLASIAAIWIAAPRHVRRVGRPD